MLKWIRIVGTFLWIGFVTGIGALLSIFRPFDTKNMVFATKPVSWAKYFLGFDIEIRNAEILTQYQPCIFISNHQDNLDIIPGTCALPPRTVSVGKRSLMYVPLFGQFYWLAGNILINRSNQKKAFQTMDTVADAIKTKNISVWIFPEGTRSKGKTTLLPFKKGPFITAIKAQVPIIPIAISNYTLNMNLNKWHSTKIIVDILPPIFTKGLSLNDVEEIKERAFVSMKASILKSNSEILNANS